MSSYFTVVYQRDMRVSLLSLLSFYSIDRTMLSIQHIDNWYDMSKSSLRSIIIKLNGY